MKNYKSIDLFAGIGGIRLGFERDFGDNISTDFGSDSIAYLYNLANITFEEESIISTDKVNLFCMMIKKCDSKSVLEVISIGKNIGKLNKLEDKRKLSR